MLADRAREVSLETTVRERLDEIESALLRVAEADSPMVTEAAQHVIAAGGKRFRPLLVVLASQLGPVEVRPGTPSRRGPGRLVVELTHVASLYHDDVMDEARLRRGSASANARWGNTVAILVGDFLFARASEVVAELGPGLRTAAGPHLRPARPGSDRRDRRAAGRRPAGALPDGGGRQDGVPDRHLRPVRGQGGRRRAAACSGRWRRTARRSAPSSSSPTTSSTSPPTRPARPRAPTCARASRPCRPCCSGDPPTRPHRRTLGCCSCWTPTSSDDADLAEALVLLRAHPCVDAGPGRGRGGAPTAPGPS